MNEVFVDDEVAELLHSACRLFVQRSKAPRSTATTDLAFLAAMENVYLKELKLVHPELFISPGERKKRPRGNYVYRHYAGDGTLLYVGCRLFKPSTHFGTSRDRVGNE